MHAWAEMGFFGGHVALDFVNTIDDDGKTRVHNGIPDWPTLVDWACAAGVLGDDEARPLREAGPAAALEAELAAVHDLREVAWRALARVAADRAVDDGDRAALADAVRQARATASLAQDGRRFAWSVDAAACGIATIRTRLVLALAELLECRSLERLRECGRCTGLFLDHGRGAGRRWCRMETCGNRAKVERYRGRRR